MRCIGTMYRVHTGLQSKIKPVAPKTKWTHCIICRVASSLNEELQIVVKTVNLNKPDIKFNNF